ncbi:MAG: hypothetical protein ABEI06_09470 [Halobacteriaceae archaeon]
MHGLQAPHSEPPWDGTLRGTQFVLPIDRAYRDSIHEQLPSGPSEGSVPVTLLPNQL